MPNPNEMVREMHEELDALTGRLLNPVSNSSKSEKEALLRQIRHLEYALELEPIAYNSDDFKRRHTL